jgi:hypothetical protein
MSKSQRIVVNDLLTQMNEMNVTRAYSTAIKRIDYSDIQFDRKIGSGKFGIVFVGTYRNQTVAVKQVRRPTRKNDLFLFFIVHLMFILCSSCVHLVFILCSSCSHTTFRLSQFYLI